MRPFLCKVGNMYLNEIEMNMDASDNNIEEIPFPFVTRKVVMMLFLIL